MPFFFILPAWVLCLRCGIVFLCFQRLRRTGLYAITISTAATVISLILSTAVLYLGPRIGLQRLGRWSGVVLIGAYILAIGVGALIGMLYGVSVHPKAAVPEISLVNRRYHVLTAGH